MFGKKRKIAKADELRIALIDTTKKAKSIAEEWGKKLAAETSPEKRKQIDNKYSELFAAADLAERAAYSKYYKYVDKNFSSNAVGAAVSKSLKNGEAGFISKDFIKALGKG